jgi:acyl transferase domain-containing protein
LESAHEVLESAGYNPEAYEGSIGVYAGCGMNTYLINNLLSNQKILERMGGYQILIGSDKDFLTTRVSYRLNLKGPSINVQTACSTSLVSVHLASQSLLNYECDMAIAGGVSLGIPQKAGYLYQEGMIMSPDGRCRAFDAKAQGTVSGEGVGVVLLKRLADALADGDSIRAVIKGSAINNDGSLKIGYTAPSIDGQAEVIAAAQATAGIEAETISYVETHGTGTPLGDPIEFTALKEAFLASTDKRGFCAIGSVKSNIGHLDTAAGVAGLIKTVLALQHKLLPPSLHFKEANPQIDFNSSPFYVNTDLTEWKAGESPRRAGVSSFGIGGTNAHVIVEEAPVKEKSGPSRTWQLIALSAKSSRALTTMTEKLGEHLRKNGDLNLADAAYTLQVGRRRFNNRLIAVCQTLDDASLALDSLNPKQVHTAANESDDRPVVFMFSGQGSQYVNMARDLYEEEPTFRDQVDICAELLKPHIGCDLRDVLYPVAEKAEVANRRLSQTALTQPTLFVVEYALARLWEEWGVRPQAMIGHSIGEYVAACLAGVFTLEEALALVAMRGQLVQTLPSGAMLSVALPEKEILPLLNGRLSLAAINGPSLCVISGAEETVNALEANLIKEGVSCTRLHTSHAFHSKMMEPILPEFIKRINRVDLKPPQMNYVSNVTGTWITEAEATNPIYWANHLRQTVRFADGVARLLRESDAVLLEVGPGRTLVTLAQQHRSENHERGALSSLRHPKDQGSDVAYLLKTLGRLWLEGVNVEWKGFYENQRRHRVCLPTYPFERQRYWIEPKRGLNHSNARNGAIQVRSLQPSDGVDLLKAKHSRPKVASEYVAPKSEVERTIGSIWQELLGIEEVGVRDSFFELGGHSLLGTQVMSRIYQLYQIQLPVRRLFEAETVEALAKLVETSIWSAKCGSTDRGAQSEEREVLEI